MAEREKLEDEFTKCLSKLAKKTREETNYYSYIFERMLHERKGVETAKYLINTPDPSKGYTKLWELGRIEFTVEAYVWDNEKWHCLFTEKELEKCRNRLRDYKYIE